MSAPATDAEQARALAVYAHLQERIRQAGGLPELWFTISNETWQLFAYRQGLVWQTDGQRARLRTVSGLAQLGEDSPYTGWLRRFGRWLDSRPGTDPAFLAVDDVPAEFADGWREWLPTYLFVQPVVAPDGRRLGICAYALDDPPSEIVQEVALRLFAAYGHAWASLTPPGRRSRLRAARVAGWGLLAACCIGLALPVRLSVLAPAEIIGLDALAVSAPMDGVIASFAVQPNQAVRKGELLFTLDETTLRNRREVASRQLQVARADALAAAQKAFSSDTSRAELASLNGKVAEREAELRYVEDLLRRIEVRSPADGVVVFGDVNDWQGKPVVTGERVALLADPRRPGVLVWLAVSDAINIELGAQIRVYLQVSPLEPLAARLSQTSYQAATSPDGVSAYRLRAQLDADERAERLARIGLKGTAKIYGERAPVAYFLFRRPLAALRAWTGL